MRPTFFESSDNEVTLDNADLDRLLGPLARRVEFDGVPGLLAVMTLCIREQVSELDARRWLRTRIARTTPTRLNDEPSPHDLNEPTDSLGVSATDTKGVLSLGDLASGSQLWSESWEKAELFVGRSPSKTGGANEEEAMRRDVVRKLYGLLLMPLPDLAPEGKKLGYALDSKLRVTATIIALKILTDTPLRNTAIITHPFLLTEAGWSRTTARKQLDTLAALNLIKAPKRGTGRWTPRDSRYIIRQLDIDRRDELRHYTESIESVAQGAPDTLAKVILSATHPAWAYSTRLNHGHWLLLLAQVAGIDPARFKMRAAMRAELRGTLKAEHLIPETVDRYLKGILDRIADNPDYGRATQAGIIRTSAELKADERDRQAALSSAWHTKPNRQEKPSIIAEEQKAWSIAPAPLSEVTSSPTPIVTPAVPQKQRALDKAARLLDDEFGRLGEIPPADKSGLVALEGIASLQAWREQLEGWCNERRSGWLQEWRPLVVDRLMLALTRQGYSQQSAKESLERISQLEIPM